MNLNIIDTRWLTALSSFLIFVTLSILLLTIRFDFIFDDSFIYFRYIDNFANGHGLSFNKGQPYEGFSGPLWVLLLGSLKSLIPIVTITLSKYIGIILFYLTSVTTYVILLNHYHKINNDISVISIASIIPVFFLLSVPGFTLYSISGMENILYSLLLILFIFSISIKCISATTIVFCLLIVTRPEALLFVFLIFLGFPIRLKKIRDHFNISSLFSNLFNGDFRPLVIFFSCVLIFGLTVSIFRVLYFGDLIPATIRFKSPVGFIDTIAHGKAYVYRFYSHNLGFTIATLLSLITIKFWWHDLLARACFFSLVIQNIFIIYVGGDWMGNYRFFASFIPIFIIIIGISVINISSQFPRFLAVPFLVLIVSLGFSATEHPLKILGMSTLVDTISKPLGLWLKLNTTPDTLLAVGDAGAIPYYSDLPIIDLHGLLTPELIGKVGGFSVAPHQNVDADYVFKRRPGWMVIIAMNDYYTGKAASTTFKTMTTHGKYPLYDQLVNHPTFKKNYVFEKQYFVTKKYYYHIYYNKQVVSHRNLSFDMTPDSKGNLLVYFNNDIYHPSVKKFEPGTQKVYDFVYYKMPFKSLRIVLGNAVGSTIKMFSIKSTRDGAVKTFLPREISTWRTQGVSVVKLRDDFIEFKVESYPPLIFPPSIPD